MSCENKLTNLVFKNKENSARTQCASLRQEKKHKNQRTKRKETQGPRKTRQIRDTESHQLLDEESHTYFYQEVW